jgi:hypothetical protein
MSDTGGNLARANNTVASDRAQDGGGAVQSCELAWIEIVLLDDTGAPIGGIEYKVVAPDGVEYPGVLDGDGFAHVGNIPPGDCQISFPTLDRTVWRAWPGYAMGAKD